MKNIFYGHDSGFTPPPNFDRDLEINYFSKIFTEHLLQEIVNETNRFAKEKIQKNTPLQRCSMWHSFEDETLQEFKAFLGVIINMGMNPKTS